MLKYVYWGLGTVVAALLLFGGYKASNIYSGYLIAKANTEAIKKSEDANKAAAAAITKGEGKKNETVATVSANRRIVERISRVREQGSTSAESCQAERNKIAAYAEVFGECAARLIEMGEAADDHAISQEVLYAAFPN